MVDAYLSANIRVCLNFCVYLGIYRCVGAYRSLSPSPSSSSSISPLTQFLFPPTLFPSFFTWSDWTPLQLEGELLQNVWFPCTATNLNSFLRTLSADAADQSKAPKPLRRRVEREQYMHRLWAHALTAMGGEYSEFKRFFWGAGEEEDEEDEEEDSDDEVDAVVMASMEEGDFKVD